MYVCTKKFVFTSIDVLQSSLTLKNHIGQPIELMHFGLLYNLVPPGAVSCNSVCLIGGNTSYEVTKSSASMFLSKIGGDVCCFKQKGFVPFLPRRSGVI